MLRILTRCLWHKGACILFALLLAVSAYAQSFSLVPNTTQQNQVSLADGSTVGSVRFVIVDGQRAVGSKYLDVNVIWDNKSELVWWAYEYGGTTPKTNPLPWTVSKTPNERALVGFSVLATRLQVRMSTTAAKSVSAAQVLVMERLSKLSPLMLSGADATNLDPMTTEIPLRTILGSFFFTGGSSQLSLKTAIRRVMPTANGWQIELDGADSQVATVSLSQDLRVMGSVVKKN